MTVFNAVSLAPSDPILGLNEQFALDPNPHKVNLGMGVYLDESGKLPLLRSVAQAEARLTQRCRTRGYLPIDGIAGFNAAAVQFTFGSAAAPDEVRRIAAVQCLGGTGALKLAADFLARFHTSRDVLVSNPTWENHRGIFSRAGFRVDSYPYYDPTCGALDFDGMLDKLAASERGAIVVLHACCHNPTGMDLSAAQWDTLIGVLQSRKLLPILDMAYQGFGEGIDEDNLAARKLLANGRPFLVATSFSKSFSLYGERAGALSVVTQSTDEARRVLSQLKTAVRTNYSTPPTHGAALVAEILGDPGLKAQWMDEVTSMRMRIKSMRQTLYGQLQAAQAGHDFSFMVRQTGMFTFSGMNALQMKQMREKHSVYGIENGRICIAGLNESNIGHVAKAMAEATRSFGAGPNVLK